MENVSTFEINCDRVSAYLYWKVTFLILFYTIWFFGIGLILALIYGATLGHFIARKQAKALKYWLDEHNLKIEEGIFFLNRKSIPLDRITDFNLYQDPLHRLCGIWTIKIQTAGSGEYSRSEGVLMGLTEPEKIRDILIAKRDASIKNRNS